MWTIEEPCVKEKDKIWADIPSWSEMVRCWHLVADVECPPVLQSVADFKITRTGG